jgi:lipopolysaccharide transport system ATP-binding protein
MKDVSVNDGRTVLFVSHNMAAVKTLCSKGIVLEYGKIAYGGDITNTVNHYLKGDSETQNKKTLLKQYDTNEFKLNEISLKNLNSSSDDPLLENEVIELMTDFYLKEKDAERYYITYHLYNESGEALFSFSDSFGEARLKPGQNNLICRFPASFFQSGTYYLSLFLVQDKRVAVFHEKDIICFTVADGGRELGTYMGREPGFIKPNFKWENKTP